MNKSSPAFISTNKIEAYRTGELSGLTFAVKDNIDVANEITSCGSPCWAETHPKAVVNAICVDQLLPAGTASRILLICRRSQISSYDFKPNGP